MVICQQCDTFAWGYEQHGKYPKLKICATCKAMKDIDWDEFLLSDYDWDEFPFSNEDYPKEEWPGKELVKEWNEIIAKPAFNYRVRY